VVDYLFIHRSPSCSWFRYGAAPAQLAGMATIMPIALWVSRAIKLAALIQSAGCRSVRTPLPSPWDAWAERPPRALA